MFNGYISVVERIDNICLRLYDMFQSTNEVRIIIIDDKGCLKTVIIVNIITLNSLMPIMSCWTPDDILWCQEILQKHHQKLSNSQSVVLLNVKLTQTSQLQTSGKFTENCESRFWVIFIAAINDKFYSGTNQRQRSVNIFCSLLKKHQHDKQDWRKNTWWCWTIDQVIHLDHCHCLMINDNLIQTWQENWYEPWYEGYSVTDFLSTSLEINLEQRLIKTGPIEDDVP